MSRIFISYRMGDSFLITYRIYDKLVSVFGAKKVFRDIDNISTSLEKNDILLVIIGPRWKNDADDDRNRRLDDPNDFVRLQVEAGLKHAGTIVIPVLVGDDLKPKTPSKNMLDEDEGVLEVLSLFPEIFPEAVLKENFPETFLKKNLPDSNLPESLQEIFSDPTLPRSLRGLSYLTAISVRQPPDFDDDVQDLIRQIKAIEQASLSFYKKTPFLIGAGLIVTLLLLTFIASFWM